MITILKSDADKIAPDFAAAVEECRQALLAHRFSEPARQYVPGAPAIPPQPAIKDTPAVTNRRGDIIKPARPGRPAIPGKPARAAIAAHPGEPRPTAPDLIEQCMGRVQAPGKPDDFVILPYEIIDDTPAAPTLQDKKDLLLHKISVLMQEKFDDLMPKGKAKLIEFKAMLGNAKKAKDRTDEDNEFIKLKNDLSKEWSALYERSLYLSAEVEDLTEENIDSWVPTF